MRLSVVAAAAVLPAYPRVGAFVLPVSSSTRGFSQKSVGSSSNRKRAASTPSPASAPATIAEESKSNPKRVLVENNGSTLSKDVVAAVGRTHSIVRLLTRIRRKDGSENFGGFVYVWDGSPQRDFVLWVFLCTNNITPFSTLYLPLLVSSLCLFYGYHAKGYHAPSILQGLSRLHHCTATTPVYLHPGYHATAPSSISGLSHLSYHASPHT